MRENRYHNLESIQSNTASVCFKSQKKRKNKRAVDSMFDIGDRLTAKRRHICLRKTVQKKEKERHKTQGWS